MIRTLRTGTLGMLVALRTSKSIPVFGFWNRIASRVDFELTGLYSVIYDSINSVMASLKKFEMQKLPREFYLRPTLKVAKELIGKFLVRRRNGRILVGRIVEVEAYLGSLDPASHAFKGRTKRNEVMFGVGGHLYVYFTYGMHFCCNIVTEQEGTGHAILLRAVEPTDGLDLLSRNRGIVLCSERAKQSLCNGPAKLCKAFAIARDENGIDLCGSHVWLAEGRQLISDFGIATSTRVGISKGKGHEWRFYMRGNAYVSKGKPVT